MKGDQPKRVITHGSLFAGIGGFDLGFERAGIKTVWQVEIDPFCRRVLERHFPEAQRFDDIRKCAGDLADVEIISGGFPCQPFSPAGKRQARNDDRYLWPEMFTVIRTVRPAFVVGENSAGLTLDGNDGVLEEVLLDLEGEGYETLPPIVVPACAFGAWHRRDRVWIIAHLDGDRQLRESVRARRWEEGSRAPDSERGFAVYADAAGARLDAGPQAGIYRGEKGRGTWDGKSERRTWWNTEPSLGRVVHGISSELDRHRIKALGNAVIPQIAEWIGRRIVAAMEAQ